MSVSLLLWMTLALSLFWGVGVYNRLMRMRARGVGALGSVEKHMRQFGELVREHVSEFGAGAASGLVPPAEQATEGWEQLLAAWQTLDQTLKEAKATPLASEPLARLGQAFEVLQRAWLFLRAVPVDLAGPVVPEAMQREWAAVTVRAEAARNGLNQILTKYNEALEQFPARLIVGAMGLKPAGLL